MLRYAESVTVDEIDKALSKIREEKSILSQMEKLYEELRALKSPNDSNSSISDTHIVRETIKDELWNKEFTVEIVENEIIDARYYTVPPRTSISAILSRMAKEGELEVVHQGQGRSPSFYRLRKQ